MSGVELALFAAHGLHTAAVLILFGELAFATLVRHKAAAPAWRQPGQMPMRTMLVAALSWVLWLALEAALMSGTALGSGDWASAVGTVLVHTGFGRVWALRAALILAIGMGLGLYSMNAGMATVLSAALLASLALVGHANAEQGWLGFIHRAADAIHLLAAGAWLGGLAPLASLLMSARWDSRPSALDDAALSVSRYGALAALCVSLLIPSGLVNAAYVVGSSTALFHSTYGRWLMLKLALFTAMLALATTNRLRHSPALALDGQPPDARLAAARRLARNALTEHLLGLGVVVLAALLASSAPPMRM